MKENEGKKMKSRTCNRCKALPFGLKTKICSIGFKVKCTDFHGYRFKPLEICSKPLTCDKYVQLFDEHQIELQRIYK